MMATIMSFYKLWIPMQYVVEYKNTPTTFLRPLRICAIRYIYPFVFDVDAWMTWLDNDMMDGMGLAIKDGFLLNKVYAYICWKCVRSNYLIVNNVSGYGFYHAWGHNFDEWTYLWPLLTY